MSMLLAILVGFCTFMLLFFLLRKSFFGQDAERTQRVLTRISEEAEMAPDGDVAILRDQDHFSSSPVLDAIFSKIPGAHSTQQMLLQSGLKMSFPVFFLFILGTLFVLIWLGDQYLKDTDVLFKSVVLGITVFLAFYIPRQYLAYRIEQRNDAFINMFPDAIDMIVRSVRSGHPLNTALRMIAENMEPPISTEFKQVVDEIAYGRTLQDALQRLCQRLNLQDIKFFVTVLAVQQETGGNLADVLSNLSGIIRKRKQLRLKIKAITSEGRVTAWILGSMPLFVVAVLAWLSPGYLTPLVETGTGRMIILIASFLVGLAMFIVRRMVKIDI